MGSLRLPTLCVTARFGPIGVKWANSGYEWLVVRPAECRIGRLSEYARIGGIFLREPHIHLGGTHLYMGEKWIYEWEIRRYEWGTGGKSAHREKWHYRRRVLIGRRGRTWGISEEGDTSPDSPNRKTRGTAEDEGGREVFQNAML